MAIQSVLVVGATGYLGRHLVAALREGRKTLHVLVRPGTVRLPDPQKQAMLDQFRESRVRVHEGALEDPASLERACAEADAVISAVMGPQLDDRQHWPRFAVNGTTLLGLWSAFPRLSPVRQRGLAGCLRPMLG